MIMTAFASRHHQAIGNLVLHWQSFTRRDAYHSQDSEVDVIAAQEGQLACRY